MSVRIPLENALKALTTRFDAVEVPAKDIESWRGQNVSMSMVASDCERSLWYGFRWVGQPEFNYRMQRRMQSGEVYEARIIAELKHAGFEILTENPRSTSKNGKKQYGAYWFGGILSGKLDGFIRSAPEYHEKHRELGVLLHDWHVLEVKIKASAKYVYEDPNNYETPIGNKDPTKHLTAKGNAPNIEGAFWALARKGLLATDKRHYGQVQCYMGALNESEGEDKLPWERFGLSNWPSRALYVCGNTDTDQIYAELIGYDPKWWLAAKQRTFRLISNTPPERVSNFIGFPPCSLCDYVGVCHKGDAIDRNCRSCKFAIAEANKYAKRVIWKCSKHKRGLDSEFTACDHYQSIIDVIEF